MTKTITECNSSWSLEISWSLKLVCQKYSYQYKGRQLKLQQIPHFLKRKRAHVLNGPIQPMRSKNVISISRDTYFFWWTGDTYFDTSWNGQFSKKIIVLCLILETNLIPFYFPIPTWFGHISAQRAGLVTSAPRTDVAKTDMRLAKGSIVPNDWYRTRVDVNLFQW